MAWSSYGDNRQNEQKQGGEVHLQVHGEILLRHIAEFGQSIICPDSQIFTGKINRYRVQVTRVDKLSCFSNFIVDCLFRSYYRKCYFKSVASALDNCFFEVHTEKIFIYIEAFEHFTEYMCDGRYFRFNF